MANIIDNFTVKVGYKLKHPIKNKVKRFLALLLLKPIGFICRYFLKFEFEGYIIDEKQKNQNNPI